MPDRRMTSVSDPSHGRRFHVRVAGPMALFTRPEVKVERVSYEVITPSAARGVLEAVLWKPAVRWRIHRIRVLRPIRFLSVRRNEVNSKAAVAGPGGLLAGSRGDPVRPFFADDDRAQRGALLLRDVEYVLEASMALTERAGPEETTAKFDAMFERRLDRGQCFQTPYLGCREFPCSVSRARGDEAPAPEFAGRTVDLGRMLLDVVYGPPNRAVFFDARLVDGVIDVPPMCAAPGVTS